MFDQLSGVLDDWDYSDNSGRRFRLSFSAPFGQGEVLFDDRELSAFLGFMQSQAPGSSFWPTFVSYLERLAGIPSDAIFPGDVCEKMRRDARDLQHGGATLVVIGTVVGLVGGAVSGGTGAAVGTAIGGGGALIGISGRAIEEIANRHCPPQKPLI